MAKFSIKLQASRTLFLLLAGAHAGAASLLIPLALPWWLKAAIAAALAASFVFHARRDALLRAPASLVGIEIGEDGGCVLATGDGAQTEARLLGSSFVASYLTVLNFRPEGSRFARHAVILPDAIDTEDFRQLRVWLRWKVKLGK